MSTRRYDTALDEVLDARRFWTSEEGQTKLASFAEQHEELKWIIDVEREVLSSDNIFVVDPDMHKLILAAAETFQPEVLLPTDVITPSGIVWLPEPVRVEKFSSGREPEDWSLHSAFGWRTAESETGIQLVYFRTRDDDPNLPTTLVSGRHAEWTFKNEHLWTQAYLYPRVFFRLVMQRLTEVEPRSSSRGTRKRFQREGQPIPRYSLIQLRRRSAGEGGGGSGGEGGGREWDHRWLVMGHWRQQWYPSLEAHRQIWISDYVKGPPDKELIIRPRVFDVRR